MRKPLILVIGLILLVLLNYSIYAKEQLLAHGQVIRLKLAPVDPRSLMQGDYMALRFAVAEKILQLNQGKSLHDGFVVLELNSDKIGEFKRLDDSSPLANNEVKIWYRYRNQHIQFATNAFFFQEGTGKIYEKSEYGEFRVDNRGESLLTHMLDKDLKPIGHKLE